MRRTTVLALAALASGSLIAGPTAHAAPGRTDVTITRQVFDHATATYPAGDPYCAFPIQRTFDGTLVTRTTTYADGTVVAHAWVEGMTYELTNPANGKSLLSHLGGPDEVTIAPDGTVTEVVRGNDVNFTAPGVGHLTGYVGQVVIVTTPDGTTTVPVQTHNEDDSIFTAACAYLA